MRHCYLPILLALLLPALAGCSSETNRGWTQEEGYRWRPVAPGGFFEQTGFEKLDSTETGIEFSNTLHREAMARNRNYTNGSGVAAGDVNGDGWVDVYFGQMNGPNRLFINDGTGNFSFHETTHQAGVAHDSVYTTGVTMADVDGDGDLDLLVASMGGQITLYENDGDGTFTPKDNSGLRRGNGPTTLALADIDGDGDLDLYVANYKEKPAKDLFEPSERSLQETVRKTPQDPNGRYKLLSPFDKHYEIVYPRQLPPERHELGAKDQFYINDGDGTFSKVKNPPKRFRDAKGNPLGFEKDWGLTAKFQDLNGDGWPDLYVCNDFWTPDRVWINQGDGTFHAISPQAIRNFSFSSMSVDFSDINADGMLDFFVTEMLSVERSRRARHQLSYDPRDSEIGNLDFQPQFMRNSMYLGRDDDTFAEITYFSDTEATGWSWTTRFMDVNLDGYEDLLINTGNAHDVLDLDTQEEITNMIQSGTEMDEAPIFKYPPLPLANQALMNEGDRTFTEVSAEWGFTVKDVSHGVATADFDRDGDLDLALNRLNNSAAVYQNVATQARIGVQLRGPGRNTRGIGSKIRLEGGPVRQSRQMEAGGDYLSSAQPFVVFAANSENTDHRISVTWPDGRTTTVDSVRANRVYEIQYPDSLMRSPSDGSTNANPDSAATPIFRDVSSRIGHTHSDRYYNDFGAQQLVPLRLSRLGPGVSWLRADSTRGADLFVTSGRLGRMGAFLNRGNGRFEQQTGGALTDPPAGDQTTVLGWNAADGLHVVVGMSNFEQQHSQAPSAYHYRIQGTDMTLVQRIRGIRSTTGPLAAADYTGDGRLDLFLGGRFKPAKYPEDARSRLYQNRDGTFQLDQRNSQLLNEAGLVTGAVFVDYDGDGDQDLVLSRAWDSLVLLENQDGQFEDVSRDVGLAEHDGWWNGIATGDFNNDGRPDLVATNWGTNSQYQLEANRPLKMFYDDFDADNKPEVITSHYDSETGGYVPYKPLFSFYQTIPQIRRRADSHANYATSTIDELTAQPMSEIEAKQITTLRHTVFLNTGAGFTAHPLPERAQYAPAFYAGAADINNDGNEDIFLSQNLFALPKLTPRQDAGRGLWLKGNGAGEFTPVRGSRSGVKVYGEQRGAALADFNGDARVDLAVSQSGAATKLYQNQTPRRGIRVRLEGPPNNQEGFGASVRVVYADGTKGPRRDVQAGSGYWSQDSATQVLGTAKTPAQVQVTWPGGQTDTVPVSPNQHEVVIEHADAQRDS